MQRQPPVGRQVLHLWTISLIKNLGVTQMVKNSPAMQETQGSIPGLGRSPGEENANHSSILVWRIPWTEQPGGLQPGGLKHQTSLRN